MALAIRDNPIGEGRADPGEPTELGRASPVDVDPLGGSQRPSLLADGIAMGEWVTVGPGIEQRRGDGGSAGRGGRGAKQMTGEEQGKEDAEGAALPTRDGGEEVFHPGTIVGRICYRRINSMRIQSS